MIQFATCERRRALDFLRSAYPGRTIEDEGPTKDLLDLIEKDVLRVTDPSMHTAAIVPGRSFTEDMRKEMFRVSIEFHNYVTSDDQG